MGLGLGGGAAIFTCHAHLCVYHGGFHLCDSLDTAVSGGSMEGVNTRYFRGRWCTPYGICLGGMHILVLEAPGRLGKVSLVSIAVVEPSGRLGRVRLKFHCCFGANVEAPHA